MFIPPNRENMTTKVTFIVLFGNINFAIIGANQRIDEETYLKAKELQATKLTPGKVSAAFLMDNLKNTEVITDTNVHKALKQIHNGRLSP